MDDGEGEFAFCEIFAEAFVVGIFAAEKIHVVVADLEEKADCVD